MLYNAPVISQTEGEGFVSILWYESVSKILTYRRSRVPVSRLTFLHNLKFKQSRGWWRYWWFIFIPMGSTNNYRNVLLVIVKIYHDNLSFTKISRFPETILFPTAFVLEGFIWTQSNLIISLILGPQTFFKKFVRPWTLPPCISVTYRGYLSIVRTWNGLGWPWDPSSILSPCLSVSFISHRLSLTTFICSGFFLHFGPLQSH